MTTRTSADPIPHRRGCTTPREDHERNRLDKGRLAVVRCPGCTKYAVVPARPGDEHLPTVGDPRNATAPAANTGAPSTRVLAEIAHRRGVPLLIVDARGDQRVIRHPDDLDDIKLRPHTTTSHD